MCKYRFPFNNDVRVDLRDTPNEDSFVNFLFNKSPYLLHEGEPPCESFMAPPRYTEAIGDDIEFEDMDDFIEWLHGNFFLKANFRGNFYLISFNPELNYECGDGTNRISWYAHTYSTEALRDQVYDLLKGFQKKYGAPEENYHVLTIDDLTDDSIRW